MASTKRHKIDISWSEALSAHLEEKLEKPSKDWQSVRDIAKETGHSVSHTQSLVRQMYLKGSVEMRRFLIPAGKRSYPVKHYRMYK